MGTTNRPPGQVANGEDDRPVQPYRPEDAKSVGREVTFQENVFNYELLKDVLILLALSVERRANRYGLRGRGVILKLTYTNMRTISRGNGGTHCRTHASTQSAVVTQ